MLFNFILQCVSVVTMEVDGGLCQAVKTSVDFRNGNTIHNTKGKVDIRASTDIQCKN